MRIFHGRLGAITASSGITTNEIELGECGVGIVHRSPGMSGYICARRVRHGLWSSAFPPVANVLGKLPEVNAAVLARKLLPVQ